MIAAATRSRGAVLVTRNQRDFADSGVEIINPWRIEEGLGSAT